MPGSRRTFAYRLTPAPEDTDRVVKQARRVLAWACEGDDRIECHDVTGEALGIVELHLTVINRDQWACRQLAQDILNLVTWGLKNPTQLDLNSKRQQTHDHRGYAHGRSKRYNEPRPPKQPGPVSSEEAVI